MKSLYGRQFLLTTEMILISFALLGAAFIGLSYQYTIRETRDSMEHNAGYMADFTARVRAEGIDVWDVAYQLYIANVVHITNAFVLVTKAGGELVFRSDRATTQSGLGGNYLPQFIVSQFQKEGNYSDMTTLGDLFPEKHFVAGTPITVRTVNLATGQAEQTIINAVYVAAETSDITELWQAFISIFFFTAVVILCVTFITNFITPSWPTNPLKETAETTCKFGHGEHEVWVQGYEKWEDGVDELAEAFNTMADSIVKSEAHRSEFVTNISHELKTPVTITASFPDGILGGTAPLGKERATLQTISSETRRLSRLVRRILDLSRLQSAENVTAQGQFDASEVMLRVLVSLESKINTRHLGMDAQLPDGPVLVWGDPDTITQVCYNLLDNAIKFSTEGSTMGLSITTKGGGAYIAVHSHGDTIPPDELAIIFDRSHKSDKPHSVDREGVGPGLYIIKTILNNHKESISVASQNDMTEFISTLTLA